MQRSIEHFFFIESELSSDTGDKSRSEGRLASPAYAREFEDCLRRSENTTTSSTSLLGRRGGLWRRPRRFSLDMRGGGGILLEFLDCRTVLFSPGPTLGGTGSIGGLSLSLKVVALKPLITRGADGARRRRLDDDLGLESIVGIL